MIRIIFITIILINALNGLSQSNLDKYVDKALKNNIALHQSKLNIDRQQIQVKDSKAQAIPTLGFQSRYTRAGGGRTFNISVGDLVNPAYTNLNLINDINVTSVPNYPNIPLYPTIPNEEVKFIREKEQETKLSFVWPVLNNTIRQNRKLQESILGIEQIVYQMEEVDLIHEVRNAYYNYLKAEKATEIFDTSIALVKENIRTTNSLYKNNRVTKDQLLAAQAQLKSVEYQQTESRNNAKTAKAYFNYLLNRPYDSGVLIDQLEEPLSLKISIEQAISTALGNRLELDQMQSTLTIADNQMALARSKFKPSISIVADWGLQGTSYNVDTDDDFYLGSAVLSWNIFNRSDKVQLEAIEIDKQQRAIQKQDVEKQVSLQVIQAYNSVLTSLKNLELVEAEELAAAEAFKLVQRKYRLGRANQVEFTDARIRLTSVQQKSVITLYDYWIRKAALDTAMGYSRGSN